MAVVALGLLIARLVIVAGVRGYVQLQRTGDAGLASASVEWTRPKRVVLDRDAPGADR